MLKQRIQDHIIIAQLDDGATNAVTLETLRGLKEAVDQVNQDPDIKGLILTGTGRFFSSGFSLPGFTAFGDAREVVAFFEEEEAVLLDLFICRKPVVAAINGHCAAMGMIMSFASDYRIAKDHPKIKLGMSEIKIGLSLTVAQAGIVRFGADSDKTFRDLMYFGDMMPVSRAVEMGLVDEVATDEAAMLARAKEVIALWMDTPNQPFIRIKQGLKEQTVKRIRETLDRGEWKAPLADALLNPEVKATLDFVHRTMLGKG